MDLITLEDIKVTRALIRKYRDQIDAMHASDNSTVAEETEEAFCAEG